MSATIEELETQVMNLGQADRTRILERLLASIDESPEVEASWVQEAIRRKADVDSGKIQLVPGNEAIARLEAMFP